MLCLPPLPLPLSLQPYFLPTLPMIPYFFPPPSSPSPTSPLISYFSSSFPGSNLFVVPRILSEQSPQACLPVGCPRCMCGWGWAGNCVSSSFSPSLWLKVPGLGRNIKREGCGEMTGCGMEQAGTGLQAPHVSSLGSLMLCNPQCKASGVQGHKVIRKSLPFSWSPLLLSLFRKLTFRLERAVSTVPSVT
jgi:hypothetical protein